MTMQHTGLLSRSTSISFQDTISSGKNTSSTASTHIGPGYLTGKAILTVGKLTLKGIEQLVISRRLSIIAAHFPHGNAASGIPEVHGMYADLLELSRVHMYPDSTRTRAFQILMGQIARRSTKHLLNALSNWPVIELNLLFSEILSWFDPIRTLNGVENTYKDAVFFAYRKHLSKWEDHSLPPIIDFLRDFASSHEQGWMIVLSCGCLDIFLHLYVTGFQDPVILSSRTGSFKKSSILATYAPFLMEATANENARKLIQSHPLLGLWPLWPMLAFENNNQTRCSQRRRSWDSVGKRQIQWRISYIFDALIMEWDLHAAFRGGLGFPTSLSFLGLDLVGDLLEFSGSSKLDEETCFRALRSLHRLWTRQLTIEVRSGLQEYIQQTPKDHAREVFARIVQRLILLAYRVPDSDPFFKPCYQNCRLEESCPLELDGVVHFIHRLTRVSESEENLRQWLINANILKLLDITAIRLFSCGALDSEENLDHEEDIRGWPPLGTRNGPRYRALVLSVAWNQFQNYPEGVEYSISASSIWVFIKKFQPYWDELGFPFEHHENWADNWLSLSVYNAMEKNHRNDVYSWIAK